MSAQLDHLIMSVYGVFHSKTIFAAVEMEIFEVLSSERLTAKSVSEKLSTNQAATTQLLDALVSMDLLQKHCEEDPPCYSNTETTERFLVKSSPVSIRDFVLLIRNDCKLFDNLVWAVREGTNQGQRTYGHLSSDLNPFKSIYATNEEKISFLKSMRVSCKQDALKCLSAFDLQEFNRMCDLGGCTGELGYAACTAYPEMKITVVDMPSVIEQSPNFKPSINECPKQANVSFLAGDLFTDELPFADLYVLIRIVHDWNEDKINLLLTKIFKSLPSGGGLLIGETLLRDDKTGPLLGNIRSLLMLTICGNGARERSAQEFKDMLKDHGFVQVQTKVTNGIFFDAIFARKP